MSTPAGWYPQEDGRQRYWDGAQWTEHFAPGTTGGDTPGAAAESASQVGTATGTATAQRPWFKKKRVLIPAGVAGIIILGSALGAGGEGDTPAAAATPSVVVSQSPSSAGTGEVGAASPAASAKPAPPAPAATKSPAVVDNTPKIGTKVRDGKFEFVVTGVKCGIDKVGSGGFDTEAQGQFCRVSMTISNIGDEPQSMFGDNQLAFDAKGRKFSADTEASIYDPKSEVLFEEINPGNSIKGRVYFDVPKNAKLVKLELHDSMFSGGVEVALKK